MSTADSSTPASPSSPGVMNRLLRSLSISKSETPPPLPIIIPQPDPTPNDPPILPAEESAPDSKPQSKETSGALGRLKSLTKFKKEKKGDVAADSILAEVAKETLATPNKEQPTPLTLAQKIRQLVDGLPPVTGNEPLPKSKPVKKGPGGKPIPPTSETPINDPTLIAQLSTPSIMNGSDEKGAVSVWSVLEALGAPQHDSDGPGGDGGDDGTTSDNSSVMMYAPLIPTADSTVELATTELRPVTRTLVVEEEEVVIVEESENGRGKAVWLSFPWPSKSKPAPQKMIKTWVPSKTKLSVQTTWWGYRLYLPPPVLVVLSAKEIQATKRAAMITTALQWIISHLPISIVPLELQPAVLILQRIAPYLTYIGSFIAWSWATVDGFDKGNGIILSATWLLPIALIPSTWPAPAITSPTSPAGPSAPPTSPVTPAAPTSPSAPAAPVEPTSPAASPSSPTSPKFFVNMFKSKAK